MFMGGYYNPYMFNPYQATGALSGLGSKIGLGAGIKNLFKGFSFNNFLTSTGKTLNVINQAIPIFYQVKPIVNNARTMLKVVGAVRGSDKKETTNTNNNANNNANNVIKTVNNPINNNTNDVSTNTSNVSYSSNNSYSNPTFFL